MPRALAVAAHPDDIEFVMAGTLLLLVEQGWEIHYFNIANGCCGSMTLDRQAIAAQRLDEAQQAASAMGATFFPPICDDLNIFYDRETLAKVSSVVRQVNPSILLTHAPVDYMEDHENACRLAVTAAFSKNMPNFPTLPPCPTPTGDIAVYHAQPHGNATALGEVVYPEFAIDISTVIDRKEKLLACHQSQQGWLDTTQKMSSYTQTMYDLGREVAQLVGTKGYCEGWRQRRPIGFGPIGWTPLQDALRSRMISQETRMN